MMGSTAFPTEEMQSSELLPHISVCWTGKAALSLELINLA